MREQDYGTMGCFAVRDDWAQRVSKEPNDPFRSSFARDRDRILYSKEFRRLSGKTQVFVAGFDDHFRTRLTHTLEVAQIGATISKNLGLNVELTEAIALGHDVGHAPFGHVGERYLHLLMNGCYSVKKLNIEIPDNERGFKHNWQSLRVVTDLEKHRGVRGLNLTNFVRWGILNHTSLNYRPCPYFKSSDDATRPAGECGYLHRGGQCHCHGEPSLGFYEIYNNQLDDGDWSYEAFVVEVADEIAQRHHDIEDGFEAGILSKDRLLLKIQDFFDGVLQPRHRDIICDIKKRNENEQESYLPLFNSLIVDLLTRQLIIDAKEQLSVLKKEKGIKDSNDFLQIRKELCIDDEKQRIRFEPRFKKADASLQEYLYGMIINSHLAQQMDGKSDFLLRQLTKAYVANPQQLSDRTITILFDNLKERLSEKQLQEVQQELGWVESCEREVGALRIALEKLHGTRSDEYQSALFRTICDYLSGMTDTFAKEQYKSLYGD